jgi:hypothetical protein
LAWASNRRCSVGSGKVAALLVDEFQGVFSREEVERYAWDTAKSYERSRVVELAPLLVHRLTRERLTWDVEDYAGRPLADVRRIRHDIRSRAEVLPRELGIEPAVDPTSEC